MELVGWAYTGLSGTPDEDPEALRRYRKGDWVLELRAFSDRGRRTRVISIRTVQEDQRWWREARVRRPRRPRG
jgi:hypothetical protein